MTGAYLYILQCTDGSYYVGTTRNELGIRIAEHNSGVFGGYTAKRRPVTLVFSEHFAHITDAIAAERQVKGWSRKKNQALIAGELNRLPLLARRKAAHPSRGPASPGSSG